MAGLYLVGAMLNQFAYLTTTAVEPPAFLGACLQHMSREGKIPVMQ